MQNFTTYAIKSVKMLKLKHVLVQKFQQKSLLVTHVPLKLLLQTKLLQKLLLHLQKHKQFEYF